MRARVVFRTHYQVDEPAYLELLVKLCTSGVRSSYAEVVANKLADEIRARIKNFNEAAGRYAVDLASDLGLITSNNTWTNEGYLVDLIANVDDGEPEKQLSLSLSERLLHLKIFLDGDGAVLLFLADHLIQHGSLPNGRKDVNAFAHEMLIDIYMRYLGWTERTGRRVELRRKIEMIKRTPYTGNTGPHKLFVHAQTLYRLGLVDRRNEPSRSYYLPEDSLDMREGLERLLDEVPDIVTLERASASHRQIEIAAKILRIPHTPWSETHRSQTLRIIAQSYEQITSYGAPLCPLSTIAEAMQIRLLAEGILLTYDNGIRLITEVQQTHPREIRFHVDRRGRPAYLKISDTILSTLKNGMIPS